jgi:DNA helicase-2/ATP-dependent DNA helicase PcrA
MEISGNTQSSNAAPWLNNGGSSKTQGGSFRQVLLSNAIQWFAGSFAFYRQLRPGLYLANLEESTDELVADLEKRGLHLYTVSGDVINRQAQLLCEQAKKKATFGKPFASKMELDLWGSDVVLIDSLEVPEDYGQLWYLYNYILYPRFLTGKPVVVTARQSFDEYLNRVQSKYQDKQQDKQAYQNETTPEKLAWLMRASLVDGDDCAYLSSLELPPMLKPEFALQKALKERGIEAKPQHTVADLMIDLAVIEGKNKLAIQCNGSATIEAYKRRSQEIQINNILFAQGWQILKFSSSEVSDNLPQCVEAVEELFASGTKKTTTGRWVVSQDKDTAEELLRDDEIQASVVAAGGGPLAVTGGAGTGKTTCIIKRTAYLASEGISPEKILILAQTLESIELFKQKLEAELGRQTAQRFSCHTFEDIGLRIIKEHLPLLQRKGPVKIDTAPYRTMARVLNKYRKDLDSLSNQQTSTIDEFTLIKKIALYKRGLISAQQVKAEAKDEATTLIANAYQGYEDELRRANRIDAEDRITLAVHLLLQHPHLRRQYQAQYEFVLVDEYQDITRAQDVLLRVLASPADNFMVVGEADEALKQSQGGCSDLLSSISIRIPQTRCFRLEKNWRLYPAAIRSALRIIARLADWHEQKLGAAVKAASSAAVQNPVKLADENAESEWVAQQCRALINAGRDPAQIAVLYQEPKYASLLEEAITAVGIRYEAPGSGSNLIPDEVQDMLAFLKLIVDPDGPKTKDVFERVCQICIKEADPKLSGTIAAFAAQNNLSYLKAVEIYSEATADKSCRELEQLVRTIRRLHNDKLSPAEVVSFVRRAYRLDQYYRSVRVPEGTIYEPLRKLMRLEDAAYKFTSLEEFVRYQEALNGKADPDNNDPCVSILAIAESRGLEFPVVFVTGMAEGILPVTSVEDPEYIDEQRKLCYVALTRASETLYLSYPEKFAGAAVNPSSLLIDAGLIQADPYAKLQKTKTQPQPQTQAATPAASQPAPPATPQPAQQASLPPAPSIPAPRVPTPRIPAPHVPPPATSSAQIQCANCKMPLEPDARFCGECGCEVTAATSTAQSKPAVRSINCRTCNALLEEGSHFCGQCGDPIESQTSAAR